MVLQANYGEVWSARSCDLDVQSGTRRYVRAFRVQLTNRFQGPLSALSVPGLPVIGSLHDEDGGAFCVKAGSRCLDEDAFQWLNTYNYSSAKPLSENPFEDPADIEWETEQFQEVMYKDEEGKASVNSAGDPFDPMPDRDQSRRVAKIEKNMEEVPSWILLYQDAVNSSPFVIDGFTVDTGLAKIQRISVSKPKSRNNTVYRTVTILMHFDKRGWVGNYLDQGFRKIAVSSSTGQPIRVPIMMTDEDTDEQIPVTAPVLLDGEGGELEDPSFDTAVFLERRKYDLADFSVLPLT